MPALQDLWQHIQRQLFPVLTEELGPLGPKDEQFVQIISLLPLGKLVGRYQWSGVGRPPHERVWILHAFVAKSVYGLATTEALIETLKARPTLRRLCGWESASEVPDRSTFSRGFSEFAQDELPQQIHAAMVALHCQDKLVGHISRDSTAISVPERKAPKPVEPAAPPRKAGRPRKGEERAPRQTKLEVQAGRSLAENLRDLPRLCDIGCKTDAKGYKSWWRGYKLHWDIIDGDIPIGVVLTSASTHDSQVAIPLAQQSAERVRALYELMDSAYDAQTIREFCRRLGHVPIIDPKEREGFVPLDPAQRQRYGLRIAAERGNSRLKEAFGGRTVRVRGAAKVLCHLMFGVLAITALGLWARLG
jgi:Transposase DDE domain/Transposase domain (DUF772)